MDSETTSDRNLPYKRTWTPKEDATILRMVEEHGASNWGLIATGLVARTGKQCRERYHNHLQPDVKKGDWTEEEDRLVIELQAIHGNQWAKITKELPGRTDNAVKNRWHAAMRALAKKSEPQEPKAKTSTKTVIPKLPLGQQGANLRSSSGALSGRREVAPTIEEIVRKYSPRFESDMHLADYMDLNLVSHSHHMHCHETITARTVSSRENTPRMSFTVSGPSNALSVLTIATSSNTSSCALPNNNAPTQQDIMELADLMQLPTARPLDNSMFTRAPSVVSEDFLAKWTRLVNEDSDSSMNDSSASLSDDDTEGDIDLEYFYSPRISPRVSHQSHRSMNTKNNCKSKGSVTRKRSNDHTKESRSLKRSRGTINNEINTAECSMEFDCSYFDIALDGWNDMCL